MLMFMVGRHKGGYNMETDRARDSEPNSISCVYRRPMAWRGNNRSTIDTKQ